MVGKSSTPRYCYGNPDTPEGLEQRLPVKIHRILVKLPHSSKLEPRNPIGPRRILTELPRSSYEDGSRQAGRPSDPQSLTTLPTKLRLATTLRKRDLQVGSKKCGACVSTFTGSGVFIGPWESSTNLAEVVTLQVVVDRPSNVVGRPMSSVSTDFLHHHTLSLLV
jgi:hypothetical protein